jgi:hypothetical protein
MSTEVIGTIPAAGVPQPVKRTYQTQGKKVVEFILLTSDEATFLAGYTIGASTSGGLYLATIETEASKGLTRATLTYVPQEILIHYGGTSTSKSSDASTSNIPQYAYTQIVAAFTFSETNIIDGVGEFSAPTGMNSPSSGKWLKTGKSVSPTGDKYQITETWEYHP